MHGQGVFTWPDGRIYEGDYKNNLKWGQGKFSWPDKNDRLKVRIYEGNWEMNLQHGIGYYTNVNNEKRKGRWVMGQRECWIQDDGTEIQNVSDSVNGSMRNTHLSSIQHNGSIEMLVKKKSIENLYLKE